MGWCWRQRTMQLARQACAGFGSLILLAAAPVLGEEAGQKGVAAGLRGHAGAAELTLIAGLTVFSALVALLYLSQRRLCLEREARHHLELAALRAKLDRAEIFLGAETQIILAFAGPNEDPEIEGDLELAGDRPNARRVLAFGSWLPPRMAETVETSVARLLASGESFRLTVTSSTGAISKSRDGPSPALPSCESGMCPAIAARPPVCKNCKKERSAKSRPCAPFSTQPPTPHGCAMAAAS